MNKQKYLATCQADLLSLFELAKQHKKDNKQKYRIEGFIHAGRLLGIISEQEATDLMEEAHMEVFGESIGARKNRKATLLEAIENGNDVYIDIPAFERQS
jgi:hypothetical protein